jgi:[ribosomal protein S5]-alanine N-acetyltransferase
MFLGHRVAVGSFVPDDYPAMYRWANDVAAARLDGAFRPMNLKDLISWCENAGKDPTRIMLSVRLRNDPKIIGFAHIQHINAVHRSADIGIRIGEERHRGKGYGKEALAIGLEYCWNHLNLERLGLVVFRNNARAIKVYRAVGFKKEALLKRLFFIDGAWVDVLVMAAFRPGRKRVGLVDGNARLASPAVVATGDAAGKESKAA